MSTNVSRNRNTKNSNNTKNINEIIMILETSDTYGEALRRIKLLNHEGSTKKITHEAAYNIIIKYNNRTHKWNIL